MFDKRKKTSNGSTIFEDAVVMIKKNTILKQSEFYS